MRKTTAVAFGFAALGLALALEASAEDLPVMDGRWELVGRGVAVEKTDGRDTLAVETGLAYRRDVSLEDGTIEVDVKLTRRRSFVYVMVRMADDREYEEFYLRPHKSGLPDAIQYAPVHQGQSAWQLHHGPGATAGAARLHVRAAREGLHALDLGFSDRATVFLNRRPLFRGEASYSFDNPRREGLIGYDQARLYLPFRMGDNELLVVVSDAFGGMGLMARFPDPTGLELDAR